MIPPKLSIVMSYFNRKNLLLRTLESIKSSRYKEDIEIILVDDGSSAEHRLEDITHNYPFPINLIRIEPKTKNYVNPCIPFNLGFKQVKADKVLIQNPECFHVGDLIGKCLESDLAEKYISFACYSLNEEQTTQFSNITLSAKKATMGGEEGWYNHSEYNKKFYHFAACISTKNLQKIRGFSEEYRNGIGFDDDDLVLKIRASEIKLTICDTPFVLHQNHYKNNSFEKQSYTNPNLVQQNKKLYEAKLDLLYKPKLIGFSQLHNELSLGNLENWFKCMQVCDYIYIFDQNSTDGSLEYYKKFPNVTVIESSTNRFEEELLCKQELLNKLLAEHEDVDWIFWMDGDTLLDRRLLNKKAINSVFTYCEKNKFDSIILGHYNLWRSDTWHRIDNEYDHFMKAGRMAFWKNTGQLKFNLSKGLHHSQHPLGVNKPVRINANLIHKGFADENQILSKYKNYKSRGQSGWALERLLDESTLDVAPVPLEEIPPFAVLNTINPLTRPTLKSLYDQK